MALISLDDCPASATENRDVFGVGVADVDECELEDWLYYEKEFNVEEIRRIMSNDNERDKWEEKYREYKADK